MKNIKFILSLAAGIIILAGCSNYNPEKGNHYKDMEDTIKTKDSIQPAKRMDPGDSVKKY
ncbi:MAG: hypothetical protein ABWZ79_09230 [Pedobacter agri]